MPASSSQHRPPRRGQRDLDARPALLWVGDRRIAARRAGGKLAGGSLGPECRPLRRNTDPHGVGRGIWMPGPRFFGWVIGGSLPAALAANWLAGAWDQNAGLFVATPIATVLEEVSLGWGAEAPGLPAG